MRRTVGLWCLALVPATTIALAGDGESTERRTLRFGWAVPTRVGVSELQDDAVRLHYTLAVERDETSRLRVQCEDLVVTEYAGRSANSPAIAAQAKFLQTFIRGQRPDVLLDAEARTVGAEGVLKRFSAAIDDLANSDDADVGRAVPLLRKQIEGLRADPVRARSFEDRVAAPWRWAVAAWVGLPVRAGTVFEGDLDVASEIDGVATSVVHATITATSSAAAGRPWKFTLTAASDGDRAKSALAHGDFAAATDARRVLEISTIVDSDTLRPHRVEYTETLEANMPGQPYPHRSRKTRVLEFEWSPPPPPVAPSAENVRAVDAAASANMEAWRIGDAAKLRELTPPSHRRAGREEKVERWPATWSWKPFRSRIESDWALVAVRLKRGDEGDQVWPLLLHRDEAVWFVLGEGFAPAETGLITHGMVPPAPRWMEPQLEDWTLEAMTDDTSAEVVLGAPPREFQFAEGRGRVLWFKVTATRTVELRAESDADVSPIVELVTVSGVVHPTRAGTKRAHVATHALRPGTYGLAVGVEQAGTIRVSVTDVTAADLALGAPVGPRLVRSGAPLRYRLRLAAPRDVVLRAVPVAGRKADGEVVLNASTGATMQSNRGGVVHCSNATDVLVSLETLGDGEAECFLLADANGAPADATSALRPGATRELEVPANGAALVRVVAADGVGWTSTASTDDGAAVATGEFHDEHGGGVIVASRGGPVRVRLRIDPSK
ncbi:MAG: hypothetical protein K8T90_15285 [Planctomycetes bacterium]|nr:hypothetical protein [Planctomycetota bacterium]